MTRPVYMILNYAILNVAVLGVMSAPVAHSQGDITPPADMPASSSPLETVVVKASRLGQIETHLGSSVSILTAREIDQLGVDFLQDAIAILPGVTLNSNGPFGGIGALRIRGAPSAQTVVLLDGVMVNDPTSPSGGYDFSTLDPQAIDRVEVLKGPHSTLWGSDAMGGVVAITTKPPQDGIKGQVFAEYGSFTTLRRGASLGYANTGRYFELGGTQLTSQGISKADENNGNIEEDPYDSSTLYAQGGIKLTQNTQLSSRLRWANARTDFDSFSPSAEGGVIDGNEYSHTDSVTATASLYNSLWQGRFENQFQLSVASLDRNNFRNSIPSFSAKGTRTLYRYQANLTANAALNLALGAERERLDIETEDSVTDSLFGLIAWQASEKLTLTGGLRRHNDDRYGAITTGRLAAAYNPSPTITLRSSWGEGFKAPTLFQTTFFCCGAMAANTDLQAETSSGFDMGFDWRHHGTKTTLDLTYFYQNSENLIVFEFADGTYSNVSHAKAQGLEISASAAPHPWVSLKINYAFIDTRDSQDNQLTRIPQHSGDFIVSLDPDGPLSASILFRHNGIERNSDLSTLSAWNRLDLSAQYQINDRLEAFARIENLLNKEYQQVLGYGTPDLSGYIGLRWRY